MARKEKYMPWIKNFAVGSFSLYAGNTIDAFQPLDFFHFFPLWYDLWVERTAQVIKKLDLDNKHFAEIKELLPTPSSMRAILQKLIPSYMGLKQKNANDYKIVANFFARMLAEACPSDPFGLISNPLFSNIEVKNIIEKINWQEGNVLAAKQIGKLITTAGSLVHGLYNDLVTDFAWDAYGPFLYNDCSLLIRDFPDLQPKEIWDNKFLPSIKSLKIYGLYRGVEWKILCVGCHTVTSSGSPISGLSQYYIEADGKEINGDQVDQLIQEFAVKAEEIYLEIRKKNFEELKNMVATQECYQLKKLFDVADINWRPTDAMVDRFHNKPLLKSLLPQGKMMGSVEEYIDSFGLRIFAKEVLEEEII